MISILSFLLLLIPFVLSIDLFANETWTSGLITINSPKNQLFYILFKSRYSVQNAPLIIWLSGGPGCASTLGLFEENGPYKIDPNTFVFRRNEHSWNEAGDVLYVDQPLDVGFSSAENNASLCKDESCVARNFYTFLLKFMETYPEYRARKLFLTGESYAGRYIPAIAAYISKLKGDITLNGIAIGNPYIEEQTQIATYPAYLYENEVIGIWKYTLLRAAGLLCQVAILLDSENSNALCDPYTLNLVNLTNPSNIKDNRTYFPMHGMVKRKLMDPSVQKQLGVNKTISLCNSLIPIVMAKEKTKSQRKDLEYVLNSGLKTMLYFGANDAVCNWKGGEQLALSLDWLGQSEFRKAQMKEWKVEEKVAGLYRKYKNFIFMKVNDAGHMVPFDQPLVALQMIKEFIKNLI
eukprot:TRINITY_DN106346_c0_g1_i1.p1 TRINITY_DN106346_c0_g1~~TRINITY_DN106346_c0_g1_i1.p1  ORF type:complete len:407 (-),score=28.47 TRINITY_DN106346_c0_g1_i1:71-1291(-)